jgi:hypothetical protein
MEQKNKLWWENRVLRSVDNLRLWHDNPRLDPASKLITVRDFVEELILEPNDENKFINLVKSIATRGFRSIDPVVIWKNEAGQFVVAEGNRRILALKLLRNPEKAPLSIRKSITEYSRLINRDEIEKVKVCLAPSYEETRWYILQRHSPASNQARWQRLQIQRFIINVYDSVNQNIDETIKITGFQRSEIIQALRYVKLRDIAAKPEVLALLTEHEQKEVTSHHISMTILERWFGSSRVKEAWHLIFTDSGITINADLNSFYAAYAKFLKFMISPKDNGLKFTVNTRTIDNKFEDILSSLPQVLHKDEVSKSQTNDKVDITLDTSTQKQEDEGKDVSPEKDEKPKVLKGNPKRGQFTDNYHAIKTNSYKVIALFDEFKRLPLKRYPNVAGASLRIFLELAVDQYVVSKELQNELAKKKKSSYNDIRLKDKLSLLRGEFIVEPSANKVIDQLLHMENDFSLNTLNEYIHSDKCHKVEAQFLNRFWDMMTPLFYELINLEES